MPFTSAPNRADVFLAVPIIVDFPRQPPDCSTNLREIGPLSAREPAKANPSPSKMDFLPSSITLAGMSSYFVPTTKSPTYFVRPGDLGKSPVGRAAAPFALFAKTEAPSTPREVLPKSRRRIIHRDAWKSMAECHTRELRLPCRHDGEPPDSSD